MNGTLRYKRTRKIGLIRAPTIVLGPNGQSLLDDVIADQHALEEEFQQDAQVASSHLDDAEIAGSPASAVLVDRDLADVVPPNQCAQRRFDGQIEMTRRVWHVGPDDLAAIDLERVGQVIHPRPE